MSMRSIPSSLPARCTAAAGLARPLLFAALLCAAGLNQARAQGESEQPRAGSQSSVLPLRPDPGGRTRIGAFAGFTDRREAEFTAGIQLEHLLDRNWSAGAVLEHTPDEFRDNDATLMMGLVNYRPDMNRRLVLTGGAGVELNDRREDGVMFRTGVGYDLFVEGPFTFTPRIAMNFGELRESITLGATMQLNF